MDPAVLYRHRVSRDGKRLDIFFSTFMWCLSRLTFIPTPICSLCQVLACRLRSAPGIVGVQLPNSAQELRVSGYTDDTTVVISTDSSLAAVFEVYHEYELGSGAKLNRTKSKGLSLGAWKHNTDAPAGLDWVKHLPVLGAVLSASDYTVETWEGSIPFLSRQGAYH